MAFPVYKVYSPKLKKLLGVEFEPGGFFGVLLLKKEELFVADVLAENGFRVELEEKPKIDLEPYGFKGKLHRCFVFLDPEKVEELNSLSDSYRLGLIKELALSVSNSLKEGEFTLLGHPFSPQKPLIMGIVNVTPDSFYSSSRAQTVSEALKKAEKMVEAGADIIDVGGMSTRPGSEEIDLEEEKLRVLPVIKEIASNFNVLVSVDTYRCEVAEEAIQAGAKIINDVFGLRKPGMMEFAAKSGVPVVVMHLKGESPKNMQENPYYDDVISEIFAFFNEVISRFLELGGNYNSLILDPGIGFGKRYEDNLTIISNLNIFSSFGLPLLIGHSRKSFIGIALSNKPPEERLYGTISAGAIGVFKGASILRVHDVKEAKEASLVASALRKFALDG